jgi:hypothetical protein
MLFAPIIMFIFSMLLAGLLFCLSEVLSFVTQEMRGQEGWGQGPQQVQRQERPVESINDVIKRTTRSVAAVTVFAPNQKYSAKEEARNALLYDNGIQGASLGSGLPCMGTLLSSHSLRLVPGAVRRRA